MSISAQSCASVPPAPAWISTSAGSGSSSCVSLNVSSLWRAHGAIVASAWSASASTFSPERRNSREDLELVLPFLEVLVVREDALGALQLAERLLRLEGVRPEAGLAGRPLELFLLFRRLADVKDSPGGRSRTTRVRAGAQCVLRSRGTSSRRRTCGSDVVGRPPRALGAREPARGGYRPRAPPRKPTPTASPAAAAGGGAEGRSSGTENAPFDVGTERDEDAARPVHGPADPGDRRAHERTAGLDRAQRRPTASAAAARRRGRTRRRS